MSVCLCVVHVAVFRAPLCHTCSAAGELDAVARGGLAWSLIVYVAQLMCCSSLD